MKKRNALLPLTVASIATQIPLVRELIETGSDAIRTSLVHRFGLELRFESKGMLTMVCMWLHKRNPDVMKGIYDVNYERELHVFATDYCGEDEESIFSAWMFPNIGTTKYRMPGYDTLVGRRLFIPLSHHTFAFLKVEVCRLMEMMPLATLTIIGENAYREARDLYESIRNKDNSLGLSQGSTIAVHTNGGDWNSYEVTRIQDGETIINRDLRNHIFQYIDNIMSLRKINRENTTLPYADLQAGIILYGKPGTGKSSLLKEIAGHYDSTIVYVNPFNINKIDWDEVINENASSNDRSIVFAYEDIDIVCTGRDDPDKKKSKDRSAFQDLLRFIDGSYTNSYANMGITKIHIATTNHLERLEDALIRPGRFDMKIEMLDFTDDQMVIDLCAKFDISEDSDICQNILKSDVRNPAMIQSMILNKVHELAKGGTDARDKE